MSENNKVNDPTSLLFELWRRLCDARLGKRLARMDLLMLVSSERNDVGDFKLLISSIASNLASCGACPGEAEGELSHNEQRWELSADCSSLPGVDQVRCEEGRCVVGELPSLLGR